MGMAYNLLHSTLLSIVYFIVWRIHGRSTQCAGRARRDGFKNGATSESAFTLVLDF